MSVAAPGSGWPGDPASSTTPVARSEPDVVRLSANAPTLDHLDARVSVCCACPRLVEWRERVAEEKRAAFRDEPYWGRPIPGWGDPSARLRWLGLLKCRGSLAPLNVYYAVDEARRIVYVTEFRPFTGSPLDEPPDPLADDA